MPVEWQNGHMACSKQLPREAMRKLTHEQQFSSERAPMHPEHVGREQASMMSLGILSYLQFVAEIIVPDVFGLASIFAMMACASLNIHASNTTWLPGKQALHFHSNSRLTLHQALLLIA